MFPIYVPGWTINYEMFFYLIFSVFLLVRHQLSRMLLTTGALVILVLIGSVAFSGGVAGWVTAPILLEFALGIVLGAIFVSRWRLPPWAAIGALALGTAGILISYDLADFNSRALLWGPPAALIVFGATQLERHGKIPSLPFLHLLGDASYALYLTHLFAIGVLDILWGKLQLWQFGHAAYIVSALAVSVALGILVHWFIEKPLIRLTANRRRAAMQAPA
jgi:exopolysaccharide production protein ExoZ